MNVAVYRAIAVLESGYGHSHSGGSSALGVCAYGKKYRRATLCEAATALRAGTWALLLLCWFWCPRYGHSWSNCEARVWSMGLCRMHVAYVRV